MKKLIVFSLALLAAGAVSVRDKTKMKAFNDLSDDEVKALVAHIRSFKK